MKCIIGLDGLSLSDLKSLHTLLPRFSKYTEHSSRELLKSDLFAQPQAIWAEFLTGSPWYENGCAGYSYASSSLNKVEVFDEKSLTRPVSSSNSSPENPDVFINVPLVRPATDRIWLSDGSLPIVKSISPTKIQRDAPFSQYKAKPYLDIGSAVGSEDAPLDCFKVETTRLECAKALFETGNWNRFFLRISLFDQLTHLSGLNFLKAKDLKIRGELVNFCNLLDSFLETVFKKFPSETVVLSSFSHTECTSLVGLNELLRLGGFLSLATDYAGAEQARIKAIEGVSGTVPDDFVRSTFGGRLQLESTIAASISAGCIYINSKDRFEGGSVEATEVESTVAEVKEYLDQAIGNRVRGDYTIVANPTLMSDRKTTRTPDLVVNIQGAEFHNMHGIGFQGYDCPRTTHCSKGFAVLPQGVSSTGKTLSPSNLMELFADVRDSNNN